MAFNSEFSSLITPFMPLLRRYCLQLASGSGWDAEDLLQESLIKLHRSLSRSQDRPITKAYLYQVARSVWIDSYRKQRRQALLSGDDLPEREYEEGGFLTRETMELLAGRLTAQQTVLVILVDIFSFSAKEAAQLIESTEGAVKEALRRARKRLAKLQAENETSLSPARPNEPSGSSAWFEALIHGFQTANPYAIANAYLAISANRIALRQVQRSGEALSFTFRDPDGHLLAFTTKIFFEPVSFSASTSVS